jgi:hypothetical protein
MINYNKVFSGVLFSLLLSLNSFSQAYLYDIGQIQQIEITFTQTNWDFQLDSSKAGADGYVMASQVKVNGVAFDSVGV